MLWGCFRGTLGMLWGCFEDALGMHWGCIGDALGMHWECIGNALSILWGCFGDALGMLWRFFRDALGMLEVLYSKGILRNKVFDLPRNTTRFVHVVHRVLGHASNTFPESCFAFTFTLQILTDKVVNHVFINLVAFRVQIFITWSFGSTSWLIWRGS